MDELFQNSTKFGEGLNSIKNEESSKQKKKVLSRKKGTDPEKIIQKERN